MLLLNGPNDGGGTTQCTVLIEKQVKTHKVTMGLMAAMMMATTIYIYNDEVYVCVSCFGLFCLASLPSTATALSSLVTVRAAFHHIFDFKPLHFQHFIMMMRNVKMMMID